MFNHLNHNKDLRLLNCYVSKHFSDQKKLKLSKGKSNYKFVFWMKKLFNLSIYLSREFVLQIYFILKKKQPLNPSLHSSWYARKSHPTYETDSCCSI